MRRRHLLALSAGALAAPALIVRPAHAEMATREVNGYRIRTFDIGMKAGLHDVACDAGSFVWATGQRNGRTWQESYAHSVYPQVLAGREWTAIQTTTASSVCAVLDLLVAGRLPQRGFVKQEDIRLDEFLANRFGRHYERPAPDQVPHAVAPRAA